MRSLACVVRICPQKRRCGYRGAAGYALYYSTGARRQDESMLRITAVPYRAVLMFLRDDQRKLLDEDGHAPDLGLLTGDQPEL